jgi:hypothetical protein
MKEVLYAVQNLFYRVSKAKEKLGLTLSPLEESLTRAIAWFRRNGYVRR